MELFVVTWLNFDNEVYGEVICANYTLEQAQKRSQQHYDDMGDDTEDNSELEWFTLGDECTSKEKEGSGNTYTILRIEVEGD